VPEEGLTIRLASALAAERIARRARVHQPRTKSVEIASRKSPPALQRSRQPR
jgi:hypothetical protein